MIPRLIGIWQTVRSSLWAVPLAMICVGVALAIAALSIRIGEGGAPAWYLYSGSARAASEFLGQLVSSMITMTTLAISITMVVLALAAQQLGPRLIRNFMRDWRTQISLGFFSATVVYLLVVLRTAYGVQGSAPNLATTVGAALVFLSVFVLLLFVHHLARSIIADHVIESVGLLLDREIDRLLPERELPAPDEEWQSMSGRGAELRSPAGGYIQAIDFDTLLALACEENIVIELDVRAGHHQVEGSVLGWAGPDAKMTPEICARITDCLLIGKERTAVQDIEFSIRHLVEIAVRALSPGVNDPYTAMAVIDRLAIAVAHVMRRGRARGLWRDGDGTVRIAAPVSTFEGIADAAFNQIRQHAQGNADVLIRMAEKLVQLMQLADDRERPALAKHLELVRDAGGRSIDEQRDLDVVEERVDSGSHEAARPH